MRCSVRSRARKQAIPPRRTEQGFALLFILLIAAGIAIAMYAELPRVAFETQRNREELGKKLTVMHLANVIF